VNFSTVAIEHLPYCSIEGKSDRRPRLRDRPQPGACREQSAIAVTSYALIGAGGYIAPRHMHAIQAVGGRLEAAVDPNDSVGIIDSYFPDAHFFTEFERFDRHVAKLHRQGERIDYMAVCSPNHLHDAHCRFALRSDADAICEKPLVLNPGNLDSLLEVEQSTGRRVFTIQQLRLHPSVTALKQQIEASAAGRFQVELVYITPRGRWYDSSWKGDDAKSGGIATNIGVHFFDMLCFVFGPESHNIAHLREPRRAAGLLVCGRAEIRWFMSIDRDDLPAGVAPGQTSYRSITVDGHEIEFSSGFGDLHVKSYQEILAGRGFTLETVRPAVEIVSALRTAPITVDPSESHSFARRYVTS
jgi:UDP-N-acetyl-2-amino-2-deoxyglucuronate dehydrogenase